jgi:Mor family transcriptional regulator
MTTKQERIKIILPIIAEEYKLDLRSTISSLAKKYDISVGVISKYFKESNLKVRTNFNQKLTESQEIELVLDYESGFSKKKLSEKYDMCLMGITKVIKRRGAKIRSRGGQKVYTCNESFFEKIDSHLKAQILGLLYADGNVMNRYGGKMWRIELQERDKCLVEQVALSVDYNGPLQEKVLKNRKYVKLAIARAKMVNDLINLGCAPNKTLSLKFPSFLEKQYWASFLYGYWLGDGWCSFGKRKNFYFGFISSDEFIKFAGDFLEKELKIKCSISLHCRSKGVSELRIVGAKCAKFWHFISENILLKLDRKIKKANAICEYALNKTVTEELTKSQKNNLFVKSLTET